MQEHYQHVSLVNTVQSYHLLAQATSSLTLWNKQSYFHSQNE